MACELSEFAALRMKQMGCFQSLYFANRLPVVGFMFTEQVRDKNNKYVLKSLFN